MKSICSVRKSVDIGRSTSGSISDTASAVGIISCSSACDIAVGDIDGIVVTVYRSKSKDCARKFRVGTVGRHLNLAYRDISSNCSLIHHGDCVVTCIYTVITLNRYRSYSAVIEIKYDVCRNGIVRVRSRILVESISAVRKIGYRRRCRT